MQHSMEHFDFLSLTPAERLLLAQELLDSIYAEVTPPSLSEAQIADLERRRDELLSGKVKGLPWDQVKQSLLATR